MLKKSIIIVGILFMLTGITTAVATTYSYFKGHEEGVVVLMYHDFGYGNNSRAINAEVFEEQMAALAASEYDVISMDQFIDYTEGRITLDKKSVLITFDDGYEDFYEIAYPILKRYNFTATNFIIVNYTQNPSTYANPHLTWDQMREMKADGFSFYSHTYKHHLYLDAEQENAALVSRKEGEPDEKYVGRVKSDLRYAHELLTKELGDQPNILAFPYGRYSEELLEICKELGIEHTFTIDSGINQVGSTVHSRVNAGLASISGEDLLKKIKRQ